MPSSLQGLLRLMEATPIDTGAAYAMFELRVMLMMEVSNSLNCILCLVNQSLASVKITH